MGYYQSTRLLIEYQRPHLPVCMDDVLNTMILSLSLICKMTSDRLQYLLPRERPRKKQLAVIDQITKLQILSNIMSLQEQHSRQQQLHPPDSPSQSSASSLNSPPLHNLIDPPLQRQRSPTSHAEERISRSRSRQKQKSHNGVENERLSNYVLGNLECGQSKMKEEQQRQASQAIKMKKNGCKIANSKEDKNKKKKVQRPYLTDFTDFLPQPLLLISRTNVTSKIRIGQRYQAKVGTEPKYLSKTRSLQDCRLWNGSTSPQNKPTAEHLWRFKQLLGENRNEQQLISMRMRMGSKSWRQLLQYVSNNRAELRRIFHTAQRNRLI